MTAILKVDTIQDTSGNNIINESSDTITIGASGDTITIPAGATITNSGTATGFGGVNTPAFLAKPVTAATLSDDTITKISFTEAYDSDNKFDGSKFTPGTAGHYQVNAIISLHNGASNGYGGKVDIYKNGSVDNSLVSRVDGDAVFAQLRLVVAGVIYLDADDYIEVYASFNTTSGNTSVQTLGQFSAFRILGT